MSKSPENLDRLTCVAAIAGAHGVHGNAKVKSFTANPADFATYGPLYSEAGEKLFTPKNARPVGRFFSLSAQEKFTREQVEALKSTKLYVPRDALPAPDEDEFYYSDLIGLPVLTTDGDPIGTVSAVHEFGAGDVLEVKPPKGPTFFHPFTEMETPTVDLAGGRILIVMREDDPEETPQGDGAPR